MRRHNPKATSIPSQMAWKAPRQYILKKILLVAILLCFLIALFLGTSSLPSSYREHYSNGRRTWTSKVDDVRHRLAVIVPFRDRFEELLVFAPFIHRYLTQKDIHHDIVVVNQVDTHRFNRASLINVGFLYATSHEDTPTPCDYIAMHDVDLLPLNDYLPYNYPDPNSVLHVAAPGLHPKYNYPTFIGGILIVSSTIFRLVDGMSNVYWGWGLEDDEFYVRLRQSKIQVIRPTGITTGTSKTFRHSHSARERPRDHAKCFDQYKKTRKRDRFTGVSNVNYTLQSVSHLMIEEAPVVILNVQLHCNTELSPWCDCSKPTSAPVPSTSINSTSNDSVKPLFTNLKKKSNKSSVFSKYSAPKDTETNKIS